MRQVVFSKDDHNISHPAHSSMWLWHSTHHEIKLSLYLLESEWIPWLLGPRGDGRRDTIPFLWVALHWPWIFCFPPLEAFNCHIISEGYSAMLRSNQASDMWPKKPYWTSTSSGLWEDSTSNHHLTSTTWETPCGELPAKPSQPTELWDIMNILLL